LESSNAETWTPLNGSDLTMRLYGFDFQDQGTLQFQPVSGVGFPLSLPLSEEIHGVRLQEGRGSYQTPGELRRSQNWIGGTRPGNAAFVPPPAEEVTDGMGKLEQYLHDQPEPAPVLLKVALAHVQFESIHPFLDGNGRLGRLLITLLL
jgi:cell filamentation protein, protein adenylyltransferase